MSLCLAQCWPKVARATSQASAVALALLPATPEPIARSLCCRLHALQLTDYYYLQCLALEWQRAINESNIQELTTSTEWATSKQQPPLRY